MHAAFYEKATLFATLSGITFYQICVLLYKSFVAYGFE